MSKRRPPPLMPKSALLAAINNTPPAQRGRPSEVFDSHVHLWATPQILDELYWQKDAPPAVNVVKADHDAASYVRAIDTLATKGKEKIAGGTYVQIEVRHDTGLWEPAIDEIKWLCSDQATEASLQAIVPWAPLDEGPEAMADYVAQLKEAVPASIDLIRGFRYLLQDFPPGPNNLMLQSPFIESLKWLGKHGYSFDVVVDAKRFGATVLSDVLDCISRVHEGQDEGKKTQFVIDHLGKPDLGSVFTKSSTFFEEYERTMTELSFFPNVSIKYSGYLSSLPAQLIAQAYQEYLGNSDETNKSAYKDCKKALSTFILPLLEAFGEGRIMWGGDWPICKIGIVTKGTPQEQQDKLWEFNYRLGLEVLVEIGLPDEALDKIFCQNAKAFYKVS